MKSKVLKMIMLVTVFMLTMACGSKSADGQRYSQDSLME